MANDLQMEAETACDALRKQTKIVCKLLKEEAEKASLSLRTEVDSQLKAAEDELGCICDSIDTAQKVFNEQADITYRGKTSEAERDFNALLLQGPSPTCSIF